VRSSLSKIIKSEDLHNTEYSDYQYEDCSPTGFEIPVEIFPSFDEESKKKGGLPKSPPANKKLDEVEKEIEEKRRQAEELKLKAEVYLSQAKERSEEKFQEAYDKGFKQGLEEGLKAGEE